MYIFDIYIIINIINVLSHWHASNDNTIYSLFAIEYQYCHPPCYYRPAINALLTQAYTTDIILENTYARDAFCIL
jgi:hypothetical protein